MFKNAFAKYSKLYEQSDLQNIAQNAHQLKYILRGKLHLKCFIDVQFPPLIQSIIDTNTININSLNTNIATSTLITNEIMTYAARLIWRPICGAQHRQLFGAEILPSDVIQHKLGNCGFASTLSAIAKYPSLIKKLFNSKLSTIGVYELRLCLNGIWTYVIVDDCIPCTCDGKPIFTSHDNKHVVWVQLVEKCAAKMYGGYNKLGEMCELNAFHDLTGYPVEEIDFNSVDNNQEHMLWNYFCDCVQNKSMLITVRAAAGNSKSYTFYSCYILYFFLID